MKEFFFIRTQFGFIFLMIDLNRDYQFLRPSRIYSGMRGYLLSLVLRQHFPRSFLKLLAEGHPVM
jgi:hypothetical protein